MEESDITYAVTTIDGKVKELVPGGAKRRVLHSDLRSFAEQALALRLNECTEQLAAMRRGLFSVVPERGIRLMTWSELEVTTAGQPEIDIALLRKHTEYEGYRKSDRTIRLFWNVLSSFTNEERSMFIRFVWGRSRLPITKRWSRNMKVTYLSAGADSLPLAHTCFFSIELPPYDTEAAMRRGLLVAIHFGLGGILNA